MTKKLMIKKCFSIFFLFLLSSCSFLSPQSSNEFTVSKKSPLIMPPDMNMTPPEKKGEIKRIYNLSSFELGLSNLRYYHYKNILAFGDLLHKIHPLAGQGFNMSIRDIRILSNIIQSKIDLGLQLDSLILNEFEEKTKNKNFLFSRSIDFIHEIFTFDKDINNKNFNNFLKVIGKNKNLTNYFIKLADKGLNL